MANAPAGDVGDRRLLKDKAVATTLYLMPRDHARLRILAIEDQASFQTLVMDAIDMLLAQKEQQPLQRWETRRKKRDMDDVD